MTAIYARQSLDKKDSVSIEGQIELCRKECPEEPKVYVDKGYSGKNTDRPAFQELMAAVERGEILKIIVYRLDRISRSITDFGRIWQVLDQHGAEFISVSEKFDTSTPVGRAMVYIIMVFAQLERETIAGRIKDNYYQRAKRGAFLGGPAPFGFQTQRTKIGGKAAAMLIPDGNVETVRQIFSKYAYAGMSLGKIAAWLTEQGVEGIGRKTWDSVSISRILHNPAYVRADADVYTYYRGKGLILYNGIEDFTGQKGLWLWGRRDRSAAKYTDLHNQLIAVAQHDGVIGSATFLACQSRLDSNRQIKNAGAGKYTWLSGVLKCGGCGYSLRVIHHARGYLYFSCSGRSNLHLCDLKHTERLDEVEAQAAAQIQAEMDRLSSVETGEPPADPHNAEKIEISKIDGRISRLMDRLEESGDIPMRYINQRISELHTRRAELLSQVGAESAQRRVELPETPFRDLDFDGKKAVVHALVERVEVTPERTVVIFQ